MGYNKHFMRYIGYNGTYPLRLGIKRGNDKSSTNGVRLMIIGWMMKGIIRMWSASITVIIMMINQNQPESTMIIGIYWTNASWSWLVIWFKENDDHRDMNWYVLWDLTNKNGEIMGYNKHFMKYIGYNGTYPLRLWIKRVNGKSSINAGF